MSIYEYERFGEEGSWKITVGWDERLETFFAEVCDIRFRDEDVNRDLDGSCVFSVGDQKREIETVEILASILGSYGEIPADIIGMLRDDKPAGLTPLTPL